MLFGKAGWAEASFNTSITAPTAGVNKWQSGYTVGGGAEYKITHNWILGAEFDYYHFKFDRSGIASDGSTISWNSTSAPIYSLNFSLSYLFNVGSPVVARY
jgi:opacity protein-like surface antigen